MRELLDLSDLDGDFTDPLHDVLARLFCAAPFAMVRQLFDLGVPRAVVAGLCGAGDIAVAGVDLSADGSRFALGGPTQRLLLAVRNAHGTVVDLVALSSACEDEWALLYGAADFLGEDALADVVLADRRELRLHPTPLAWLRAGGPFACATASGCLSAGCCCLDWNRGALGELRGIGAHRTIVVDPGARARLEAMLAGGGLPFVAEDRRGPIRRAA